RLWGLPGASEAFWTRNTGVAYGVAADDGVRVLASTGDGIAYVWRPPDPSPAREFSVDGLRLCLSPDGHTLAVADTDGRIWIWNWGARRILETAIGKLAPADLSLAEERCGALEHGCQERLWLEFVLAARRTTGH
ncbi:MAG TPA: hypothetical protein VFJ58_19920, partial [Armatimonadota bacterium]|nr:hypothetical protein [Armatimonadota bacterium]